MASLQKARALAFLIPTFLLAGAYGSQYLGGLYPCEMCYWQRWPHFAAIALALLAFAIQKNPDTSRFFVWLAALAIFTSGAIGIYHAGVEAGIFEGLTQCSSGLSDGTAADILAEIMATPIIRCDEIQFSFLGISMAGWNACLSIGFSLIIIWLSIKKDRHQTA